MFTFYVTVGLESPSWSPEECRQHATELADEYFPSGYTVIEAEGRWQSPERGPISEPSLIFIFCQLDPEQSIELTVHKFATVYRVVADQDAVLVQSYQCASAQLV